MVKYRKVSPKIWNDAKFRSLSDNAKLVFFMLLTHPQTSALGTVRAFPQGLAPELRWSEKAFREAFQELLNTGMVMCSENDGLIWLPNFIKYNPPESPNVLKSWRGALEDCPEGCLKNKIYHSVKGFSETLSQAFHAAFQEAFREPSPDQEQEQEQKKNTPPLPPTRGGNGDAASRPRTQEKTPRAPGENPGAQGTTPRARRPVMYSADFEAFWAAYPRKVGKDAAFKVWRKRRDLPGGEELAAILERQRQSDQWRRDGGQYIPHPATWLNQGRWQDELESGAQPVMNYPEGW